MSITRRNPFVIWLGGEGKQVNDIVASEAITPGHLIERHSASGTPKFRKQSTDGGAGSIVALNQSQMNLGIDDAYAAGDLVEALVASPGATFYGWVASGANLAAGAKVQAAGDGKVKALGGGVAVANVLEDVDNSAGPGDARVRLEVI